MGWFVIEFTSLPPSIYVCLLSIPPQVCLGFAMINSQTKTTMYPLRIPQVSPGKINSFNKLSSKSSKSKLWLKHGTAFPRRRRLHHSHSSRPSHSRGPHGGSTTSSCRRTSLFASARAVAKREIQARWRSTTLVSMKNGDLIRFNGILMGYSWDTHGILMG